MKKDFNKKEKTEDFVPSYIPSVGFKLQGHHANITTELVIQQLFDNLDRIPIQDLQNFLNQYPQI